MAEDKRTTIEQIKEMDAEELSELAEKIRHDMVQSVSKTGGHLASSLGVVELTLALHKVFDCPKDKIIWDVGHQTYAHKMITGRWDRMDTLRQIGGISGFPKRAESEYDTTDPGHSGTSLSIAMGYAAGRDLNNENYSVVAVIGDGALTSGVALEALDSIAAMKTPLIIILNDNEMSISRNVGAFGSYMQKLRTSDFYARFKDSLKKISGPKGTERLEAVRDALKHLVMPRDILDELGIKYYGPIDGHDIEDLTGMLSFAKTLDKPVLVHVLTTKGKGYEPAEKDPTRFHGIGVFDPEDPNKVSPGGQSWSDAFGEELLKLAKKDDKICAISAAMIDSTGLKAFKQAFPDRVFDVGIAEQHAVSFAEGLALSGRKPVAAIYSTFLQRAYDEMLTEVCLEDLPVVFAIDRAGLTGQDGETHQGIYDIAYLCSMPGMTVMCPRDRETLSNMLAKAFEMEAPVSIRYPRGKVPSSSFAPGDGTPQILKEGSGILIISDGNMLSESLSAAEIIEKNMIKGWKPVKVAVADIGTIKPLDEAFMTYALSNYDTVAVVEDGIKDGGLGSAVCSLACNTKADCRILSIGWPDAFIEHGTVKQLRARYGMDAEGIAKKITDFCGGGSLEEKA